MLAQGYRARRVLRCNVLLSLAIIALIGIQASPGAPAPDSLRLDKQPGTIVLSWGEGDGPYVVYRSHLPEGILSPAFVAGGTQETTWSQIESEGGSLAFYLVDEFLPCSMDNQCDNGLQCDGVEYCDGRDRLCKPGVPIVCNDGSACTVDNCLEETGGCSFEPLDCNDGDPCTLDACDAITGCRYEVDDNAGIGLRAELAGRSLPAFPSFEFVQAFNEGTALEAALDPHLHPDLVGATCDLYVLEDRSASSWCSGAGLNDVRGAPDEVTITSGMTADNIFLLAASDTLPSTAGTDVGKGYDLALDCDRNGFLDAGELADGLGDQAGAYVIRDMTTAGPLAVSSFDDIGPEPDHCSGGGNDDMRIYYPAELDDPGFFGLYPLVVISHGNGHCFDWYDFLGEHLASYGYIVMSHDNDTGPGIETASTTTLLFTDEILREQGTLGAGVLAGHIDSTRIAWIGHSRGGEGVARAYDRLVDEGYPSEFYDAGDIVVISSIAPTDFLGPDESDPKDKPYHLLYGSADGDVSGRPGNSIAQSFGLYERALGERQSTYVHGADHNDFNCCGFNDFAGPSETEIGRPEAQQVQKAVTLALLERYLESRPEPAEFFWRQYDSLRPLGVATDTVVVSEFRATPVKRSHVIDNYQSEPALDTSSSGEAVRATVNNLLEGQLREPNSSYAWDPSDPMNGMARGRTEDLERGVVFEYSAGQQLSYEFDVLDSERDFSDDDILSFRACQMTRHPETIAELADLTFTVSLVDGSAQSASIQIGTYGGGIVEPYQRTGYGDGAGWQNEFETIRIRISDFSRDGQPLDLQDIRTIRFDFGSDHGSDQGRVALDDLQLVKE